MDKENWPKSAFFLFLAAGIWLCCKTDAADVKQPEITVRQALDFEVPGAWVTEADLLSAFREGDLWCSKTTTYAALAGGVTLSTEHVRSGKFSGRWADHARFPSISTKYVEKDWSGHNAISCQIYSDAATNEQIFILVHSDSNQTPYKDFFFSSFIVDWKGWKSICIPFSEFKQQGKCAGWDHVSGISFCSKAFNSQPNPYTVLYLDNIKLEKSAATVGAANSPRRTGHEEHLVNEVDFDGSQLNHTFPELQDDKPVYTPIKYEPYFKAERAIFKYFPRFEPAYVSFDLKGRPYLQHGSFVVEKLNTNGRWECQDVSQVIDSYLRNTLGYIDYIYDNVGQNNEAVIRFDKDGDAYMSCRIEDAIKVKGGSKTRLALLLHSRNNMATWKVYLLPYQFVRFEKLDGHNTDCLNRPPVLLLFDPSGASYITIPEKKTDGTLMIPTPVKFTDKTEGVGCHSGDGNGAITHGNKVFFVYYEMRNYDDPNHPQYKMTYEYGGKTVYCRTGTPSFARSYDITTRELSAPVFIGWGGHELDGHNLPVISMDSHGYLHVIINGHHNPFTYAVSKEPYNISGWKEHQLVSAGTSYASINCGKDDTLYTVTRCSRRGYVFEMALHRKKYGQAWETENYLVTPYRSFYRVWFHKMTLDTQTNRLFLTYYSQGGFIQIFRDDYLAYMNIWPDREKDLLAFSGGKLPSPKLDEYELYNPPHSDLCTLVSEDSGNSWRLAVSKDFEQHANNLSVVPGAGR